QLSTRAPMGTDRRTDRRTVTAVPMARHMATVAPTARRTATAAPTARRTGWAACTARRMDRPTARLTAHPTVTVAPTLMAMAIAIAPRHMDMGLARRTVTHPATEHPTATALLTDHPTATAAPAMARPTATAPRPAMAV